MLLNPLGTVVEIVETVSAKNPDSPAMSVSFAHEDLVFLNHNAFLLQFSSRQDEVLIHINEDTDKTEIKESLAALKSTAARQKMTFVSGGHYRLSQVDQENISVVFLGGEVTV